MAKVRTFGPVSVVASSGAGRIMPDPVAHIFSNVQARERRFRAGKQVASERVEYGRPRFDGIRDLFIP
jgi:hypothetical protein